MDLQQLAARLQTLPPLQQVKAAHALKVLYGEQVSGGYKAREWAPYAGSPADYIERKLGGDVAPVVDGVRYDTLLRALDLFVDEPFVLIPGGNGQGKDWLCGALGCWHHDAVAAQPGEDGRPMGSRTLLLGPTETSVFQTTYASVLAHAMRAESLGNLMPPRRSTRTPRWMPREEWCMECIAPAAQTGQAMSHRASGRHHRNLLAILGEASGLRDEVVQSIIGSASGGGPGRLPGGGWVRNGVVCIFNPDSRDAAVSKLMRSSTWRVIHLSALDHVNVRTRRLVIPGAVSAQFVDGQVRDNCRRLGAYPETAPDPAHHDFVYALPPDEAAAEGGGPRPDGVPGHADGEPATYRPSNLVETRVLGVLPVQDESSLFSHEAWDAGVARWRAKSDPQTAPDGIGVDSAWSERQEADEAVAAPRWGPDAVELLSRWSELRAAGDAKGIAALTGAIRIGELRSAPKGDGPTVAGAFWRRWPFVAPWSVDDGGGQGIIDHARHTLKLPVTPVSFGAAAPPPEEGLLFAGDTMRDWLHAVAASAVNRGWVDIPDDPLLREEAMKTWTIPKGSKLYEMRVRTSTGWSVTKQPVTVRGLPKKAEIRRLLDPQRSPDRMDAFVLALCRSMKPHTPPGYAPAGMVHPAFLR